MKRLKLALVPYILAVAAAFAIVYGYYLAKANAQLCNHQYAICTSALCVPQPGDPTKATCFCDVEEGPSMSTVPCNSLKPSEDANGIRTVYSTFSFEQFKSKKSMKCPSGTPWTWCLNKRCTVDPSNPSKAICICDVMRTGDWTTFGGNCDTSTCGTGYWSGAPLEAFSEGNVFMTKALGLDKSPAKWCQAGSE
jgi:hypothetical protein